MTDCGDEKGRGVLATRVFSNGEFIVEYAGTLLDYSTAIATEARYAEDEDIGAYMMFFKNTKTQLKMWSVYSFVKILHVLLYYRPDPRAQLRVQTTPCFFHYSFFLSFTPRVV